MSVGPFHALPIVCKAELHRAGAALPLAPHLDSSSAFPLTHLPVPLAREAPPPEKGVAEVRFESADKQPPVMTASLALIKHCLPRKLRGKHLAQRCSSLRHFRAAAACLPLLAFSSLSKKSHGFKKENESCIHRTMQMIVGLVHHR